jgi:gamma-glutamyltranspeptidase/glutathione hydrolase
VSRKTSQARQSAAAGPVRSTIRRIGRLAVITLLALPILPAAPLPAAVRPAVTSKKAMVAMPDPVAAKIALEILRSGGNAVDAAVAAGFALAVTYPQAGNLGGGGFMLVRLAGGEAFVVDYRETAPSGAGRDMYLDSEGKVVAGLSRDSHLGVGVPGTVAGLDLARQRAGTMPLGRLLAPAIALADDGFQVPEGLAAAIERSRRRLERYPATAAVFFPGGRPPEAGHLLIQKDLARTLRLIASEGPNAFYRGAIAKGIADSVKAHGGLVTLEDMAGYEPVLREPIRVTYRGHEILGVPPPSAGGVVLAEMLHMLEPHDLKALGAGSSAYYHLLAEVMKRAYADRATFLGDPDHVRIPLKALLSREYSGELMANFDPEAATPAAKAGPGNPLRFESSSTTHFTIADSMGNVVSNTYTLNASFGLGAVVEGWGFLLNNEMDDFSAQPGSPNMYGLIGAEANAVAPGKRMLSSMTPTIVMKDGAPFLALGTPGGGRITTMVLQVIVNVLDFGMELQAAVDYPRCHHQWTPDELFCEAEAIPADVESNLRRRGHAVRVGAPRGDVHAIMMIDKETRLLRGAADARGYGVALGH